MRKGDKEGESDKKIARRLGIHPLDVKAVIRKNSELESVQPVGDGS